jgi:hypothetical protein
MMKLLSDSQGSIKKVLFHHAPIYYQGNLIQEGIFKSFLQGLNKTGVKPEVFVFATYENEEERESLAREANSWKGHVEHLEYAEIQITSADGSKPPYSQDTCIILDENSPSFILSKSIHFIKHPNVREGIADLLTRAKLHHKELPIEYYLEGGYVYATSNHLFYSNPIDHNVVRHFKHDAIFVESIISYIAEQILSVLVPGGLTVALPDHVDLIFSVFERKDSLDVFYVDFRDIMLASPMLSRNQRILLRRRFDEWDQKMKKLLDKIKFLLKNVELYKVPGFIDFEKRPEGILPYVHSTANLLFHSINNKDYAFYLTFPHEIEEQTSIQINKQIEDILKDVDISPIPVTGTNEITNMSHISNSAGARCLVKVLSRT